MILGLNFREILSDDFALGYLAATIPAGIFAGCTAALGAKKTWWLLPLPYPAALIGMFLGSMLGGRGIAGAFDTMAIFLDPRDEFAILVNVILLVFMVTAGLVAMVITILIRKGIALWSR